MQGFVHFVQCAFSIGNSRIFALQLFGLQVSPSGVLYESPAGVNLQGILKDFSQIITNKPGTGIYMPVFHSPTR